MAVYSEENHDEQVGEDRNIERAERQRYAKATAMTTDFVEKTALFGSFEKLTAS